jgi:glycosyltransferase involved in cell wall biosynthesis
MMPPIICVIIPVYNAEKYLDECLSSVCTQTFQALDIIVIDDGSTDSTAAICKNYAAQDKRVFYFYKENGGVSSARNYGINEAKGDYIVFLDSDNTLKLNTLERLNKCVDDLGDADFITYGFSTSSSKEWIPTERDDELVIDRQTIREVYLPTHFNIYPQDKHFLKNFVWNKAYKATFLKGNRIIFDETRRTWEDGIFVINCLDKANKIAVLPEAIYNAYSDQNVDHLSSKLYVDQVLQYINDEREYKARFGAEMNFSTKHYVTSNFNVINSLFDGMVRTFGADARPVIDKAINIDIVKYWADHYKPEHETGKQLKRFIMDGNTTKIYNLYHPSFIKRVVRKVLRSIKH